MEKKYTVEEFVNEEAELEIKEYVPIGIKQIAVSAAVNKSVATSPEGVIHIDMFTLKINLLLTMVSLYSNLDVAGNVLEIYDKIKESGLDQMIIKDIKDEYKEFQEIVDCVVANWEKQYTSTEAVVVKYLQILSDSIDGVLQTTNESGGLNGKNQS